jgi:hypothetical protein
MVIAGKVPRNAADHGRFGKDQFLAAPFDVLASIPRHSAAA